MKDFFFQQLFEFSKIRISESRGEGKKKKKIEKHTSFRGTVTARFRNLIRHGYAFDTVAKISHVCFLLIY